MEKQTNIFYLFFIIMLIVQACSKDLSTLERNRGDTISLVFYNVENLFDYEIDGNEYPEYIPGVTNWNRKMYLCKLKNISYVIAEINADIVALCEVEDIDAIKGLQNKLMEMGYKYKWIAIGEKKYNIKTVPALLSKFPIEKSSSHWFTLPDSSFTRPILEVDINIYSHLLKVFVNHWPSRHQKESFRIAAAKKLREIISIFSYSTDYIIAGDFNSNYNEFSTVKTYDLDDSNGVTGINHILNTIYIDSNGLEHFYNEALISSLQNKFVHYNLWLELPESQRMSYFYKGNFNALDHIILPPSLYDTKGISYLDNSFQVITLNEKLLTAQGKPKRWETFLKDGKKFHLCEGYSDHLPIYAKFFVGSFYFKKNLFNDNVKTNNLDAEVNAKSWFESHTNGWIANNNLIKIERSKKTSKNGIYSLYIFNNFPLPKNSTIAKTVISFSKKEIVDGFWFYLKGEGTISLRIRNKNQKKWIYFNLNDNKNYGRAEYTEIKFPSWKKIFLPPSIIETGDYEFEIRGKKGSLINIWIDR